MEIRPPMSFLEILASFNRLSTFVGGLFFHRFDINDFLCLHVLKCKLYFQFIFFCFKFLSLKTLEFMSRDRQCSVLTTKDLFDHGTFEQDPNFIDLC